MIVIGGEAVITGPLQFLKAAEENNAENLLVIRDKKLAERYMKNSQEDERRSEVHRGRGKWKVYKGVERTIAAASDPPF